MIEKEIGTGISTIEKTSCTEASSVQQTGSAETEFDLTPFSPEEGKKGNSKKGKKEDDSAVVMTMILANGDEYPITQAYIDQIKPCFPGLQDDFIDILLRAKSWCINNKRKRKTASGMPRFIDQWLGTQQNQARLIMDKTRTQNVTKDKWNLEGKTYVPPVLKVVNGGNPGTGENPEDKFKSF